MSDEKAAIYCLDGRVWDRPTVYAEIFPDYDQDGEIIFNEKDIWQAHRLRQLICNAREGLTWHWSRNQIWIDANVGRYAWGIKTSKNWPSSEDLGLEFYSQECLFVANDREEAEARLALLREIRGLRQPLIDQMFVCTML